MADTNEDTIKYLEGEFEQSGFNYEAPNFSGYKTLADFRKKNTPKQGMYYDFTNEPTFLTFSIDFQFVNNDSDSYEPETRIPTSPLLDTREDAYNAYTFLKSRNRHMEAELHRRFVKKLSEVSIINPWLLRKIDGLPEIWKAGTDMANPYKDKDKMLKITTYESLDLTISYLADLYRLFALDQKFMRSILPDNLRWFTCNVYVCEFRNLRVNGITYNNKFEPGVVDNDEYINSNNSGSKYIMDPNSHYNWLKGAKTFHRYKFSQCEFDFSETVPYQSLAIDKVPDMAENTFTIKPGWNMEYNHYDLQTVYNYLDKVYPDSKIRDIKITTSENNPDLGDWTVTNQSNGMSFNSLLKKTENQIGRTVRSINGIVDTYDRIKDLDGIDVLKNAVEPFTSTFKNIGTMFEDAYDNLTNPRRRKGENEEDDTGNPVKPQRSDLGDRDDESNNESPVVAVSDINKQDIKNKVGSPTVSDVHAQEFPDKEPDVAIKQDFEVEVPDIEPDVASVIEHGQEFPDKEPNVAIKQDFEVEVPDIEPVVAAVIEHGQDFPDTEPNVAIKQDFEVEFPDTEPIVTIANEYEEVVNEKSGKPTNTDFANGYNENDNIVLTGNRTTKEEYTVEQEFKNPGEPAKSIFEQILEKENEVLRENVTKVDHGVK